MRSDLGATQNAIVKEFLIESFENLNLIQRDIELYENSPKNSDIVNGIFRKIHTLKGSAGFLGFKVLEKITHSMENILDNLRCGSVTLTKEMVDTFFEGIESCLSILKEIEENGKEGENSFENLLLKLSDIFEKALDFEKVLIKDEVSISNFKVRDNETLEGLFEQSNLKLDHENDQVPEKGTDERQSLDLKGNQERSDNLSNLPTSLLLDKEAKTSSTVNDSVVRVNVNLLNKIMDAVGELVITRNQILQFANKQNDHALNRYVQQLNGITSELQTDIMTTRLQPIGIILNGLRRVVRNHSNEHGKDVHFTIKGEETELDKSLLELIKDPLTHIVRNSLDHGIESPEKRKELGKNPQGQLEIKAFHEGGQVIVEISDDGAGIDLIKVRELAEKKGLVSKSELEKLKDAQAFDLIFTPGFSTASNITNISGRGVGMDVVKSNIDKVGGEIDISSKKDKGTAFKLKIPLTLAIVPALVIKSSKETFAIHQKNLVELVMLDSEGSSRIERLHDKDFLRLRGELIPIFSLNDILSLEDNKSPKDFLNVIILRTGNETFGLLVDAISDTQEIVVKPLDRQFKSISYYAGATIMGDGQVALVIDVDGFAQVLSSDHYIDKNKNKRQVLAHKKEDRSILEIILVKFRGEGLFGVPSNAITRLEEFNSYDIESVGDQFYIRYRNTSMLLIDVEEILSLNNENTKFAEEAEKIKCIVLNIYGSFFGLVVKDILDISVSDSEIDKGLIDRKGFLGTVYIKEKLVTILNLYEIISELGLTNKIAKIEDMNIQNLKKGKALLADSNSFHCSFQQKLLEEAGLSVVTANNEREAFEVFENNQDINVILADGNLSEDYGLRLFKGIKAYNKEIPIILLNTDLKRRVEEKFKEKSLKDEDELNIDFFIDKMNKNEVIKTLNLIFK